MVDNSMMDVVVYRVALCGISSPRFKGEGLYTHLTMAQGISIKNGKFNFSFIM